MRLLEVKQETIKVQPLPENSFSNGLPDVRVDVSSNEGQDERHVDRDSLKIPMFVSDSLEYQGDPINSPRFEPKKHISELCCIREGERSRLWLVWKQK